MQGVTALATAAADCVLLASERRAGGWDVAAVAAVDGARRGAVAARHAPGAVCRAEPGPAGPLLLAARTRGGEHLLEVWGPAATPAGAVTRALDDLAAWVGHGDDPRPLDDVAGAHPLVARAWAQLGPLRLGRLPRVGEALGRAVLGQLVQGAEAARSTAQVVALAGEPAPGGLWCWPTAGALGATPAWALRRCGVSLRMARALHAAALDDRRLAVLVGDWPRLDARLCALPGVGAWTSGETRLALGDPDAVPAGDYNLPALVGRTLTGELRPRAAWSDADVDALLAPFAGQRGRVVRLLVRAVAAGLAPRQPRRAPRARLSAHRYW